MTTPADVGPAEPSETMSAERVARYTLRSALKGAKLAGCKTDDPDAAYHFRSNEQAGDLAYEVVVEAGWTPPTGPPTPPSSGRVYTAPDGSRWVESGDRRLPRKGERYGVPSGRAVMASADHTGAYRSPRWPILTPAPTTEEPTTEEQDAGEGEGRVPLRCGARFRLHPRVTGLFGWCGLPEGHHGPHDLDDSPTPALSVPWDRLVEECARQVRWPHTDEADDDARRILTHLYQGGHLVGVDGAPEPSAENE